MPNQQIRALFNDPDRLGEWTIHLPGYGTGQADAPRTGADHGARGPAAARLAPAAGPGNAVLDVSRRTADEIIAEVEGLIRS